MWPFRTKEEKFWRALDFFENPVSLKDAPPLPPEEIKMLAQMSEEAFEAYVTRDGKEVVAGKLRAVIEHVEKLDNHMAEEQADACEAAARFAPTPQHVEYAELLEKQAIIAEMPNTLDFWRLKKKLLELERDVKSVKNVARHIQNLEEKIPGAQHSLVEAAEEFNRFHGITPPDGHLLLPPSLAKKAKFIIPKLADVHVAEPLVAEPPPVIAASKAEGVVEEAASVAKTAEKTGHWGKFAIGGAVAVGLGALVYAATRPKNKEKTGYENWQQRMAASQAMGIENGQRM